MNIPLDLINLQLSEATLSDSLSWLSSLTLIIILLLLTPRPNIELFQEVNSLCKHALSLKNILGHHKAREPFLWQFKGTQCLWRSVAPVILLLYTLIFRNLSPDSSFGCCSMLWNRLVSRYGIITTKQNFLLLTPCSFMFSFLRIIQQSICRTFPLMTTKILSPILTQNSSNSY